MLQVALLSLLVLLPSPKPQASDWPQWRGADGSGVSKESKWLSEGASDNLWSADVGLGYSSVVVGAERLYTMGHDLEGEMDVIFCLSATSGEELWSFPYPARAWDQDHPGGTVNTPSLEGGRLYALNREGNMHCLDAKTGDLKWGRQLKEEHALVYPNRGYCGSPLVTPEALIVNLGKVFSLDKETGDALWVSEHYGDGYATPRSISIAGKPGIVIFNGDKLAVLDPATGKEQFVFIYEQTHRNLNAASPVVIGEKVFISSKRLNGGMLLEFGEQGVVVQWVTRKLTTYMSGSVLMNDSLFGFDDNTLRCLGVDGQEHWGERGMGEGAVVGAGERLIVLNDAGELIIARANPERYEELSRTKLFGDEDGDLFTPAVIANGLIYCRSSNGLLICRDHRSGE